MPVSDDPAPGYGPPDGGFHVWPGVDQTVLAGIAVLARWSYGGAGLLTVAGAGTDRGRSVGDLGAGPEANAPPGAAMASAPVSAAGAPQRLSSRGAGDRPDQLVSIGIGPRAEPGCVIAGFGGGRAAGTDDHQGAEHSLLRDSCDPWEIPQPEPCRGSRSGKRPCWRQLRWRRSGCAEAPFCPSLDLAACLRSPEYERPGQGSAAA